MNAEYLLFNLLIIIGPLAASFERNLHFVARWKYAFPAIALAALPFLVWDVMVTGRHWYFNEAYTLPMRLLGLPLEEWLFFFTVPFAALFVWEVLHHYRPDAPRPAEAQPRRVLAVWFTPLLFLGGTYALASQWEYTGLAVLACGAVISADYALGTGVLSRKNTLPYLGFTATATLLFNGYLTARPVVLYNEATMSGFRLWTIPIEDFAYGAGLIVLVTVIYEWLKKRRAHA